MVIFKDKYHMVDMTNVHFTASFFKNAYIGYALHHRLLRFTSKIITVQIHAAQHDVMQ